MSAVPKRGRAPAIERAWVAVGRAPLAIAVAVWLALDLLWVRAFRGSGFAELDEAAYTSMAVRLARPGPWSDRWQVLEGEGVHGPLQSLLAVLPMTIVDGDVHVLIVLNVVLVAVTAIATAALTRQVADRAAGTLAGLVMLLSPSLIEFSRTALTAVLPMCAASLALFALARSRGLRFSGWSAAAGVAIGAMVLGRSMAIGFVPAIAVAGGGWAINARTPWLRALRNGALVVATALVTALWWWWIRWDDVSTYLFGGGSSDTEQVANPAAKALGHLFEAVAMVGPGAVVALIALAVIAVVARRRGADQAPAKPSDATEAASPPVSLALWPLGLSVLTGVLALGASSAPGVGFTLALMPATVAAGAALLRRHARPSRAWWRASAGAVLIAGVLGALLIPGRGLDLRLVWWCETHDDRVSIHCAVHSNDDGQDWRQINDTAADRIAAFDAAVAADTGGRELVAMTPRDTGVNPNSVGLSLDVRHRSGRDLWIFFRPNETPEQQIARATAEAGLLVAVEDPPVDAVLGKHAPPTAEVVAAARAAGFRDCDTLETPDGRKVWILVAPRVGDGFCRSGGAPG